jgi:uncharacterized integral membrane protein
MKERRMNDLYWGLILIVAGGIFLADNMGLIDLHLTWRTHWPIILIIAGLGTVLRSLLRKDQA